jgi:pyruvate/2-oxoglutarate dehydrogenase complex dihydrolipoamide dehydrogenase (E3) component
MTESEAQAWGVPDRLAQMPMAMVFRAITLSETRGFMKTLIGADDRILGFTAFGAEASELMAVAETAMLGGIPYTVLRDAIWTHPTTAEGLDGLIASPPSAPVPQPHLFSQGVDASGMRLGDRSAGLGDHESS